MATACDAGKQIKLKQVEIFTLTLIINIFIIILSEGKEKYLTYPLYLINPLKTYLQSLSNSEQFHNGA
mgnify:CR=1 FL=1